VGGARSGALNERTALWERRFELPILVAALLVIPVVVIQAQGKGGGCASIRSRRRS
jgi:hypothetical protein